MKRPRPHIPLYIRVAVAERQARLHPGLITYWDLYCSRLLTVSPKNPWPLKDRLASLLWQLFGNDKPALDHDPALILRPFVGGQYDPPANDPAHLIYRTQLEHLQKTIGRKLDAAITVTTKGSDIWLRDKFRRLDAAPKPKARIASRGFPKQSRPFPKRSIRNVPR